MAKLKKPIQRGDDSKRGETYLILDNIRSVHNVGSIFRTAETLGISKIFCIDTTPTPTDRFGRKRNDFAKVAPGAEDMIAWEHIENTKDAIGLIKQLKKEKFQIISLEQDEQSSDYKDIKIDIEKNYAIILGNEVDGVAKDFIKMSDIIAEIPMKGQKESLNVSVSAGIFLYRLLDR